jgi:hexulose-6-phosphate isomerase
MTSHHPTRRDFLAAAAMLPAATLAAAQQGPDQPPQSSAYPHLKYSLLMGMFQTQVPYPERIAMAKRLGYDGIEASPMRDMDKAKELGQLAKAAGIQIHSIIYGGWQHPLSDPDPAVVARGKEDVEWAMKTAVNLGADVVLLVPGVVNEKVGYAQAYENSQKNIRDLIPVAEKYKVILAIEEVWNKFLLSPIEFAAYLDSFDSEWVRAYFDVGNVVLYGYPQDWIRTLGKRIVRVHIKDFKREKEQLSWPALYEGDVDWPEVRKAFHEIGYTGWVNAELPNGDEAYLAEVLRRMRLIGQGAKGL